MNAQRARRVAHRQIVRMGGRHGAILRSGQLLTQVMLVIVDYTSSDRRGQMTDLLGRLALISTFKPDGSEMTEEPNKETDEIALYEIDTEYVEQTYRIINQPTKLDPNGVVVYWEVPVLL